MPGTGGVSALDEMRALRPGLPAILLSGYAEGNVAIGHRNVAFLAKPFDLDALTRTVRRLLEQR
jgi:DNA-binding NtrC family response regulator